MSSPGRCWHAEFRVHISQKNHGKPTKRVLQRRERGEHGLGPIRHDTSIYTRSYTVPRFPHHVSGSFLAKRAGRDEGPPGNLRFARVNSGLDASCSPGGSQCMRYVSSGALR